MFLSSLGEHNDVLSILGKRKSSVNELVKPVSDWIRINTKRVL